MRKNKNLQKSVLSASGRERGRQQHKKLNIRHKMDKMGKTCGNLTKRPHASNLFNLRANQK